MFFLNVGARASVMFFQKILMFCFSRSLYAIKRRWARFRLSFVVVNINKMIFVIKAPQREALASDNLALPSIFFNLLPWNLSKFSHTVCEICLADHLKAEKKKLGLQRKFHRYLQFCVFFLHLKFGLMNFFYPQGLGRARICLTV